MPDTFLTLCITTQAQDVKMDSVVQDLQRRATKLQEKAHACAAHAKSVL
jgi:phosphoribosyl-ATP pyrophosphohydrolase